MTEDFSDLTKYRPMANGSIQRISDGRIVKGSPLTPARAAELGRLRQEKRRQIAREAANEAVERADFHAAYGDDAYFAAIIHTAAIKATTPEDPKMIEAGRFVLTATGDLVQDAQEDGLTPGELHISIRGMVETFERLLAGGQIAPQDDHVDAIDGTTADQDPKSASFGAEIAQIAQNRPVDAADETATPPPMGGTLVLPDGPKST